MMIDSLFFPGWKGFNLEDRGKGLLDLGYRWLVLKMSYLLLMEGYVFEDKQEKFEKKLDAVYEQTVQLIGFRNEVNRKLDSIIEDNKSIHKILGEHEVSIRTLRRNPYKPVILKQFGNFKTII